MADKLCCNSNYTSNGDQLFTAMHVSNETIVNHQPNPKYPVSVFHLKYLSLTSSAETNATMHFPYAAP